MPTRLTTLSRMELPPWVVIPDDAYGYPKDWKKMLEYEFW